MMKSNIKSICQSVTEAFEVQTSNYYLLEPRTVQTFAAVETAEPSSADAGPSVSAVVELSVEPLCLSAVSG